MKRSPDACLQRARAAWGSTMPDWIEALAEECDRTSLRKTGVSLGLSPATISLLVNNKYTPRPLAGMEKSVRASLLLETVQCPILGRICSQHCRAEQAAPLNVHDPVRLRTYKACRKRCPNAQPAIISGTTIQGVE